MARTKAASRKNPQSKTPSPSPSPSPTRSPPPPPKPTPPHSSLERTFSDYLSSSPKSSPPPNTLAPLSTILPPLFQYILGPLMPHHSAPTGSLPQINTSFITLSSFCTTLAPYQNTPLSTPVEDDHRPFKRTKLVKEASKTYKEIPKIFAALHTTIVR
uniref:Uncharacterized protein n=1 Tax=Cicer arietinum TaxID=3827 RepID=A0A1S2Z2Q8_CICAR|nr:putative uncharacterized protein DDB_G0290521 [Cicer arietinum]